MRVSRGTSTESWAATVEEIALMKSADRQKILVEGARKEGKLSWYTTLIVDQVVRPVKDGFEKEYPFLQVEFFRGNTERIVQRIMAEYQAKRYDGRFHRRHGVADHGPASRISSAILFAVFGRISGGAERCQGFWGSDQSLFF